MSFRHAETGHPTRRGRRGQREEVQRITSAAEGGHVDRDARFVRYAWQMGIRTVCFVLAFFTSGWLQVVFFVLAIVLPYIAVVLANAGTVSNGDPLDEVAPVRRLELENRLQLTAGPDTVVGATADEDRGTSPQVLRLDPVHDSARDRFRGATRGTAHETAHAPAREADRGHGQAPDHEQDRRSA